jgi:hypothetical protein
MHKTFVFTCLNNKRKRSEKKWKGMEVEAHSKAKATSLLSQRDKSSQIGIIAREYAR